MNTQAIFTTAGEIIARINNQDYLVQIEPFSYKVTEKPIFDRYARMDKIKIYQVQAGSPQEACEMVVALRKQEEFV